MLKRIRLINSTSITATGKKTILRFKKKSEISKEKNHKLDKIDSLENLLHPLFNYAKFAHNFFF